MTDKKLKASSESKALLDDDEERSDGMPRERIRCLSLYHQDSPKLELISLLARSNDRRITAMITGCTTQSERSRWKRYRPWRQERNHRSARLEKQLKSLETLIDKQLKHFQAQYSRASNPTILKDVSSLLMPKSTPPLELATFSWLGDWRPSSILGLLNSLIKSSSTLASSLTHSSATEKAISLLIHDLRIEEAVIDEEITEIQANCILNIPFALAQENPNGSTLGQIQSELKKVHCLIVKAQHLRTNALETVVKKILCQSDAAEFLVAFGGIQETVHQFSSDYKLRKGPVCVTLSSGSEIVGSESSNSIG